MLDNFASSFHISVPWGADFFRLIVNVFVGFSTILQLNGILQLQVQGRLANVIAYYCATQDGPGLESE